MLKIAVCDDDVLTVHSICKTIDNFFVRKKTSVSCSHFFSGEALLRDMVDKSVYYDAVFLDIGMDGKNGIETAKQLRENGVNSFIVFITALKDYVFDAFEVDAMNYLLKPIDIHKLHKTLEKITITNDESKDEFLIINKNREVTKIAFSTIVYCEVLNHRVFVYEKNKHHEYQAKIDILEHNLSQDFFRSHRSFIVNLSHVTGYSDGYAVMSSGEKIPVATRRHSDFMKALVGYALFFLGITLPPISEFLGLVLAVLSVFLFTRFILKQNLSVSVFLAFLVMTVNIMVESILTPLLSILVRTYATPDIIMHNISLWCFVILSITVFSIYTNFFAIDEEIKGKIQWILSTPLLFICLILRPYIATSYPSLIRYGQAISDTSLSDDIWILVISVSAMLTVSSILFAYKKLILQSKIENDALLLSTQISAQKSYIEEVKQRYDATSRFRHDFKNHISILGGLITERDFEKASDYLSRFNDCYDDMTFQIATGNTTLDILLSEKLHIAKQHDITLKIDIDIGKKVCLDNFDLCTIFANAVDNAIKGANSANKGNRIIEITAKQNKGFYIIDLINSFDEANYEKGSGIGITTIKMIAEKYNGYVDISSNDKMFRLSILLPLA